MATAALLGSSFATTGGTATVTATPTIGDVIVVIAAATGIVTTLTVSDNNADGHGTFLQILSVLKNASADVMSAWVRADPIRSATSTVWTSVQTSSTGGGLFVYRVAGLTLTALQAIKQSGSQANGAAAGTPTVPLGVAALTGNPLVGAVFNGSSPAAMTVPTGWTEDFDNGYATPTTGMETVHINSGFTGSSVAWGSTSATAFSALAVELNAAQGNLANSPEIPPILAQQAVRRSATFCLGEKWARRKKSGLIVPAPGRAYAIA